MVPRFRPVLGRKVRNEQVTLPGQVKARGPDPGAFARCVADPELPRGYPEATPRFRPVVSGAQWV